MSTDPLRTEYERLRDDASGGMYPLRLADCPVHASGLRLMPRMHGSVALREHHTVAIPPCCPVSGNPREGSTLTVSYTPDAYILEVYGLRDVVRRFRGGFPGNAHYPAERNMEGMVQLVAQMASDALGVPVRARANLLLDTGPMRLTARAG